MTTQVQPRVRGTVQTRRALGVAAASAAALIAWAIVDPVGGVRLAVHSGDGTTTIGPVSVLMTSLVTGLLGWACLAVLERVVRRPRLAWTGTAAVSLALSLLGPLGSAVDGASRAGLVGLHIVVGVVLIAVLGGTAPSRRAGR